jgi:hypothetical protein
MPFINRGQIDPTTGIYVVTATVPTVGWPSHAAIRHEPATDATAHLASTPPAGTDAYVDGMRFTAEGQLYTWDFDSRGLPPGGATGHGGYLLTQDGALITTADPIVGWSGGWPIAANSYVVAAGGGGGPLPGSFTFSTLALVETVQISWQASANATSYKLYRDLVLVYTHPNGSPSVWGDGGGVPGSSYTMEAINANGTTQSSSNPQVVPTTFAPGAFTFRLRWIPGLGIRVRRFASVGATTFNIYRNLVLVRTVIAGTNSWTDTSAVLPGTYSFTVEAVNAYGTTQASNNPLVLVIP